jgi:hypothetical protein
MKPPAAVVDRPYSSLLHAHGAACRDPGLVPLPAWVDVSGPFIALKGN